MDSYPSVSRSALPPLQSLYTDKSHPQEAERHSSGRALPAATSSFSVGSSSTPSSNPQMQPPALRFSHQGPDIMGPTIQDHRQSSIHAPQSKQLLPSLSEALGVKSAPTYSDNVTTPVTQPSSNITSPHASSQGASPPHHVSATHASQAQIQERGRNLDTRSYEALQQLSARRTPPPSVAPYLAHKTFPVSDRNTTYESPRRDTSHFSYGYLSSGLSATTKTPVTAPSQRASAAEPQVWSGGIAPPAAAASSRGTSQAYSESVKHHLDLYDFEVALNEILENSNVTGDFVRQCGVRLHHAQRAGLVANSLPEIMEVEDLMNKSRHNLDALARLRDMLITRQQNASVQQDQDRLGGVEESIRMDSIADDSKPDGFAGSEPKKRRGRNAAPGRCHSCNRAETPEWRRGPDGARTLCNACGLHYAKLTRKAAGANKAAPITSSGLRPQSNSDETA